MAFVLQPRLLGQVANVERLNSGREAGPRTRLVTRCNLGDQTTRPPVIVTPKPRLVPVGPPPEPVPIQHSPTFVQQQARQKSPQARNADGNGNGTASVCSRGRAGSSGDGDEPFTGNAVQYLLRKADRSLDEIEENPPEAAKAIYEVSKGPVGEAAAKSVEIIGKVGYMAGKEAVKALVPVAGKVAVWAVQQSTRAAFGAVGRSLREGGGDGGTRKIGAGGSGGGGDSGGGDDGSKKQEAEGGKGKK